MVRTTRIFTLGTGASESQYPRRGGHRWRNPSSRLTPKQTSGLLRGVMPQGLSAWKLLKWTTCWGGKGLSCYLETFFFTSPPLDPDGTLVILSHPSPLGPFFHSEVPGVKCRNACPQVTRPPAPSPLPLANKAVLPGPQSRFRLAAKSTLSSLK